MIRVTADGKVLYLAEKPAPRRFPRPASPDLFGDVARNFQLLDPLDFIAELTQHIPDTRKHLGRAFGWYSSKARGLRVKANREQGIPVGQVPPASYEGRVVVIGFRATLPVRQGEPVRPEA